MTKRLKKEKRDGKCMWVVGAVLAFVSCMWVLVA